METTGAIYMQTRAGTFLSPRGISTLFIINMSVMHAKMWSAAYNVLVVTSRQLAACVEYTVILVPQTISPDTWQSTPNE